MDYIELSEDFVDTLDVLLNARDGDDWEATKSQYSPEIRGLLNRLDQNSVSLNGTDVSVVMGEVDTEAEVSRLYKEIASFGQTITSEDVSAKNTYFRVSASLLEKLVLLREKAAGQKAFDKFVEFVVTVHEDLLTADQSTEFRERLEDHMEKTQDGG